MIKELLLAFSNQVLLYKIIFGSVIDDSSVELENSVH